MSQARATVQVKGSKLEAAGR